MRKRHEWYENPPEIKKKSIELLVLDVELSSQYRILRKLWVKKIAERQLHELYEEKLGLFEIRNVLIFNNKDNMTSVYINIRLC